MAKRYKKTASGTMLEMWRPPREAGEPIGCLTTTYTFQPGIFDEQCLARFLEIESEPDREDLAFLLDRETRLGAVYAGVLVDHTQSGVEHSLRWDVLPVRIPRAKQHAKLSLLAWNNHLRIVVASANLTEQGYRLNQEICVPLDCTPDGSRLDLVEQSCGFLRQLLEFVPGAGSDAAEVRRARAFLDQVQERVSGWKPSRKVKGLRQHLVFTLPARKENPATGGAGFETRASLADAIAHCSRHGGSPNKVVIASPFFDIDDKNDTTTEFLCKSMARGVTRRVSFCIPAIGSEDDETVRLAAPASLVPTAEHYSAVTNVEILPHVGAEGHMRPWHAKMLGLLRTKGKRYTGLMIGSSNFTKAGMGLRDACNAEANLLTIAEHLPRARLPRQIEEIWPDTKQVEDLAAVEWLGATPEMVEEQRASKIPAPAGLLSVTYHAGDQRALVLRLEPEHLPEDWAIFTTGKNTTELLNSNTWKQQQCPDVMSLAWEPLLPPEKLLVRWTGHDTESLEAFLPLNVEDAKQLPPPAELAEMTADDMLLILAASDPSAAFRAWARKQRQEKSFDEELDAAIPPDLDPLKRYELKSTFLRRVRSRARILAQLRHNLQRPVWNTQALQWRLEGFLGIRPLAERMLREVTEEDGSSDEALLTLADLVILLREVAYEPVDGSLSKQKFQEVYDSFLVRLVEELNSQVHGHRHRVGRDLQRFWERVVQRCRE